MEHMPNRQIVDFLVQYFVAEVNWFVFGSPYHHPHLFPDPRLTGPSNQSLENRMDQLVHIPWFLPKYHSWWLLERAILVAEVDFIILILRVCCYTLRFLPSPSYPLDKIRGVLLSDVRKICDETVDNLAAISARADSRASLIRVQHLTFLSFQHQVEGGTNAFWEGLSRAIRAAQDIGIHRDAPVRAGGGVDKTIREMERRTFCNLYIWDSLLSRQLDRMPLFPGRLAPGSRPNLHFPGGGNGTEPGALDAPDQFTERLLQADLADFWRAVGPIQGIEYDMMAAEERYNRFCRDYSAQLPRAFALADPDEAWDTHFPKLPLQRKLLHLATYESICWNFRPLLAGQTGTLDAQKSMLLSLQKRKLAAAALHVLDSATQVQALFGGCLTRISGLVFSIFEAAVLLVSLSMDPAFPKEIPQHHTHPSGTLPTDPLYRRMSVVTQLGCSEAAEGAHHRLKMLSAASSMAETGANALAQLLGRASELRAQTEHADAAVIDADYQGIGSTITTEYANTAVTATAAIESTSALAEVTPWVPEDLAGPHPESDITWVARSLAAGEIAPWSSFDTWSTYMPDTAMELWPTHETDIG